VPEETGRVKRARREVSHFDGRGRIDRKRRKVGAPSLSVEKASSKGENWIEEEWWAKKDRKRFLSK